MQVLHFLVGLWLLRLVVSSGPPFCTSFVTDQNACGGESALTCSDDTYPATCACADKYRAGNNYTVNRTVCGQWPATIQTTAIDSRGIRRFNRHERNAILFSEFEYPEPEEVVIFALSQIPNIGPIVGKPYENLVTKPKLVCGQSAVSFQVVYYQFHALGAGYTTPLGYSNWTEGAISPWQQGPRLPSDVYYLFDIPTTPNAADTFLSFVRCGCRDNVTDDIFYTHQDRIAQANFTCDNFVAETRIEVQLEGDRITDLAGPTARDALALIPESAVPFVDNAEVESKDLGAEIKWADCQRNIRVKKNSNTRYEPTCEWIKTIYDMKALPEINIVDTWCDWFQDGDECLLPFETCGAGAAYAVAICPFDPVQRVENGVFYSDLNCSVTCRCRGEKVVTGTQQCNAVKRSCRGEEVDLFCPPGTCGEPNQPCKSCSVLEDLLNPDIVTLKPGTCSAPAGFEWIDPAGCKLKKPYQNCTVGVESEGCPLVAELQHVCGEFSNGCVRECIDTECKNKCICDNNLRSYYPDLNSPADGLRYTSEHACANWPQVIAGETFNNDGTIDVTTINTTFQFATPDDLEGIDGYEAAMLSALEDAGLPVELETFDNITLLCGLRAFSWSVVDYRTSEEIASTYYDWRFDTGPGGVGPELPQRALRLEDDVGVTHLTFLRCGCLGGEVGTDEFTVWQDDVIQWRYRCDTWEPTTSPTDPDTCPMVDLETGSRVCNGVGSCDAEPDVCECPGKWFGDTCFEISDTGGDGAYYTAASCPTSFDNPLLCHFIDPCGEGCEFDQALEKCVCESEFLDAVYNLDEHLWVRKSVCWDGAVTSAIDGVNPCANDGVCRIDHDSDRAFCDCVAPRSGRYCEGWVCPGEVNRTRGSVCSEHGNCKANTTDDSWYCKCNDGWMGDECAVPWCDNGCGNGTCIAGDEYTTPICVCPNGFYGDACEYEIVSHAGCEGTWSPTTGLCDCGITQRGMLCDVSLLFSQECGSGCTGNGLCTSSFLFGDRPSSLSCKCKDTPSNDPSDHPHEGAWCTRSICPLSSGTGEICNGTGLCQPDGTCDCNGNANPNAWFIELVAGSELEDDETAFKNSAAMMFGGGLACDEPLNACIDRPITNGVGADRTWNVTSACGGPDAGYCTVDPLECFCRPGYIAVDFGFFDVCLAAEQVAIEVGCETGVWNNDTMVCDCPDIFEGVSCNISLCLPPLEPFVVDDEWKCRCPEFNYNWTHECTEINCTETGELCTGLTCPYIDDLMCGGWTLDVPIPFDNDALLGAGFNIDGINCGVGVECNCSDVLYEQPAVDDMCVPLWNPARLVSLTVLNSSNLSAPIITVCEDGWDPEDFCATRLCSDNGFFQDGEHEGCEAVECCCNNGWDGPTCAEADMPAICINEEISSNGGCYCPSAFSVESDCSVNQCANTSTFDDPLCDCDDDWLGLLCDVSSCWNGAYLNDAGCECEFPYSGPTCQETSTLTPTTLSPTATVYPTSTPTTMRPTFPVPMPPTPSDATEVDIKKAVVIIIMCIPFALFRYSI